MLNTLISLHACQRGATAIEYGLIVSLVVVAMMTGLGSLAGGSNSLWGRVSTNVVTALG